MKNLYIAVFVLAFFLHTVNISAQESGGQYGQYGGAAPSYSIIIDKMVATPNTPKGGQENYVDNLSPSDTRFKPQDFVKFRIKVKNTSSITLKDVKITDILPSYVIPIEGPGPYDEKAHKISYTYFEIKPQEEKISFITVKIKNQEELPADKGLMCQNNKAIVEAQNTRDEDTSQYCLEKQVVSKVGTPPEKTPEAGAPLFIMLGMSLIGLTTGVYLSKKQ